MENYATAIARPQRSAMPLKDSIRDMIRLQRDYNLSDELFWEVFNNRVLLNEQIDVDDFLRDVYGRGALA
ncbi:hypothetical protein GCM10023189_39620 [Nibrella saemangeumensis]|uniref:Uncharacterized protein n=2 Tax=Nibrella saemangeumensis TaxID=1084526 RepID=A0ABP8NAA4_9BACT